MNRLGTQVGRAAFPVPHAAGTKREEKRSRQGLFTSFHRSPILDERCPPLLQEFCSAFPLRPAAAFPLSLQHRSFERRFVINIPDVCADAGAAPESPE